MNKCFVTLSQYSWDASFVIQRENVLDECYDYFTTRGFRDDKIGNNIRAKSLQESFFIQYQRLVSIMVLSQL